MSRFTGMKPVFKREFSSYFATPLGYIIVVIFLFASGYLTVSRDFGRFIELREASLEGTFFAFLPWIYAVLVPAVAMRLWAEERKTGTVELLFTLPITLEGSYLGKFLAGWAFLMVSLALTFPVPLITEYLGNPDWGVILTGYLGSALLAAIFLAVGMLFSAVSKNQIVAFILGFVVSVLFLLVGRPESLDFISSIPWMGGYLEQIFGSMSLTDHFSTLTRGLVELRTLVFFGFSTVCWLICGMLLLDRVKAS